MVKTNKQTNAAGSGLKLEQGWKSKINPFALKLKFGSVESDF